MSFLNLEEARQTKQFPNANTDFLDKDLDPDDFFNEIEKESKTGFVFDDPLLKEDSSDNENKPKQIRKKRRKSELDTTPLPLFDCIYCVNEIVVFNHYINNKLEENYLFNCSPFDYYRIDRLIANDKDSINHDLILKSLYNSVINNMEYIQYEHTKETSIKILQNIPHAITNVPFMLYTLQNDKNNQMIINLNTQIKQATATDINFNYYLKKELKELSQIPKITLTKINANTQSVLTVDNQSKSSVEDEEGVGSFLNFLKFEIPRKVKHNNIVFEDDYVDIYSNETINQVNIETHKYRKLFHIPNTNLVMITKLDQEIFLNLKQQQNFNNYSDIEEIDDYNDSKDLDGYIQDFHNNYYKENKVSSNSTNQKLPKNDKQLQFPENKKHEAVVLPNIAYPSTMREIKDNDTSSFSVKFISNNNNNDQKHKNSPLIGGFSTNKRFFPVSSVANNTIISNINNKSKQNLSINNNSYFNNSIRKNFEMSFSPNKRYEISKNSSKELEIAQTNISKVFMNDIVNNISAIKSCTNKKESTQSFPKKNRTHKVITKVSKAVKAKTIDLKQTKKPNVGKIKTIIRGLAKDLN